MSSNPHTDSLILILDVQSSRVRGSLVLIKKELRPTIVFSYEAIVTYRPEQGGTQLFTNTLAALDAVINQVLRIVRSHEQDSPIPRTIDEIHFVLSSPWIMSRAKTVSASFKKEVVLTPARIRDIVSNERVHSANDQTLSGDIIEEKITDVRIDGVSVPHWENSKAKNIEISYAVSVAGTSTIDQLRRACAYIEETTAIFFHSALLLQHAGIQAVTKRRGNYTLVHVHGELTDIVHSEDGICTFFASYPIGVNTVARTLATELNLSVKSTDSSISLYEHGQIDAGHGHTAHTAISKAQHLWVAELEKVLTRADATYVMNSSLIVSAHAHEIFFIQALKSVPAHGFIEQLDIDEIRTRVSFETNVPISRMIGLYAIAIHSLEL